MILFGDIINFVIFVKIIRDYYYKLIIFIKNNYQKKKRLSYINYEIMGIKESR